MKKLFLNLVSLGLVSSRGLVLREICVSSSDDFVMRVVVNDCETICLILFYYYYYFVIVLFYYYFIISFILLLLFYYFYIVVIFILLFILFFVYFFFPQTCLPDQHILLASNLLVVPERAS